MSSPFVSIIVPTFNSSATLQLCLRSILNQKYKSFEILIVDNLSTDYTIDIAQSLCDDRIKIYSQKDDGIYDAMNKGIKHAKGEWLYFLGSDDSLFDNHVLANIYKTTKKFRKSKFIFGDVYTSNNYFQNYNNFNYEKLLDMCICHQAIFYHRSLFKDYRYDLKYKLAADWDFNLKVFRRENNPYYINLPIARYNLNGASANWSNQEEYIKYFISNKKEVILRYRDKIYLIYYFLYISFYRFIRSIKLIVKWICQ